MELRRQAEMRQRATEQPGAEEARAPERMRPVHDASLEQELRPVGLDIEDDFDAADHQADRQQHQEQRDRLRRVNGDGVDKREQRHQPKQRAAKADALQDRGRQRQRGQGADRRPDQAEPQRAVLDRHGALDVRQPRENVAHGEGVDCETGIDAVLRGELEAKGHGGAFHEKVGRHRRSRYPVLAQTCKTCKNVHK